MTIKEWYQRVKDPVLREKLLKNFNPSYIHYKGNVEELYYAILYGFDWEQSTEGYDYWSAIVCKANREIELYPEDYGTLPWENNEYTYKIITKVTPEHNGIKVRFKSDFRSIDGILFTSYGSDKHFILHNDKDSNGDWPTNLEKPYKGYSYGYSFSDINSVKIFILDTITIDDYEIF